MWHSATLLAEFAFFIFLTLLAINASKKGFRFIGRYIATKKALEKPRNLRKFSDQSWQLVVHTTLTVGALAVLHQHQWTWWITPSSAFLDQGGPVIPVLQRFYHFQLAVYFYTAFSHRFLEAHHKDYFVMFGHHVATIFLIMGSNYYRYHRFGLLIMLVHDASDIPADLVKMANYMGLDGSSGLYITEGIFVCNLLGWAYARLYIFPFKLMLDGWRGCTGLCQAAPGQIPQVCTSGLAVCFVMKTLLLVLVCMHVWWFLLFLRVAFRLLTQDAHAAAREEYEGASDSDRAGTSGEHSKRHPAPNTTTDPAGKDD